MTQIETFGGKLRADSRLTAMLARIDGTLVHSDTPQELSPDRAQMLLARVCWSRICEPGDGVAGSLIAAVGPERALNLVLQSLSAHRLASLLHNHGTSITTRMAAEALSRWETRASLTLTTGDIERAIAAGLHIVAPGDPAWPTSFGELDRHTPLLLWCRGNLHLLRSRAISVVGARAATGYGTHVTAELVQGLGEAGLTIVSGAAYGIDAVAHRTALAAGAPTIAMVAGGADRAYPSPHASLLDRIAERGLICSEMIPDSAPTKWRFLQRNRLIAAFSDATLVTEAGVRSGSLNTAGHAAQLGRAIGAVPGPITSATSAGCHRLVREFNAELITTVRQACELAGVNDELQLFAQDSPPREREWQRRVRDALPLRGSRSTEEIASTAGLTVGQVHGVLAELELLGRVRRSTHPGDAQPRWRLLGEE